MLVFHMSHSLIELCGRAEKLAFQPLGYRANDTEYFLKAFVLVWVC